MFGLVNIKVYSYYSYRFVKQVQCIQNEFLEFSTASVKSEQ